MKNDKLMLDVINIDVYSWALFRPNLSMDPNGKIGFNIKMSFSYSALAGWR